MTCPSLLFVVVVVVVPSMQSKCTYLGSPITVVFESVVMDFSVYPTDKIKITRDLLKPLGLEYSGT